MNTATNSGEEREVLLSRQNISVQYTLQNDNQFPKNLLTTLCNNLVKSIRWKETLVGAK